MAMKARYTVMDGEIVAEKRNGVERDYLPTPLGSTAALLDSTQVQTDSFTQWPYGEERSRTGSTPTPFRFAGTAGYYRDSARMQYARGRHLGVEAGRWVTPDPIWFAGGDVNLYRYVANRPSAVLDPSGLSLVMFIPCASCLGAAGAVCIECGWDWGCWRRCLREIWDGLPSWIREACYWSCSFVMPAPQVIPAGRIGVGVVGRVIIPRVAPAGGPVAGGTLPRVWEWCRIKAWRARRWIFCLPQYGWCMFACARLAGFGAKLMCQACCQTRLEDCREGKIPPTANTARICAKYPRDASHSDMSTAAEILANPDITPY